MSFAYLPGLGVLAGLVALAGLLFVLQLLRIRYVRVTVPTTLFWRAAAREAPVRVLRGVFRHPLAYLLALAICALLWLAFASPETATDRAAVYRVLFLDGSAHAAAGDDFDAAVAALKADLGNMPAGRREVIWGGARNIKLLRPGEDRLLLDQRLASLAPEAAPSALDEQLRLLARPGLVAEALEVIVYGRAGADPAVLARLPPSMSVRRAVDDREPGSAADANAGITALGVAPAASGRWDRVDLMVRVSATSPTSAMPGVSISVAGEPLAAARLVRLDADEFAVRDLAADGRVVEVRTDSGDAQPLDDAAHLRLPRRRIVRVALADGIDGTIRRAIDADPGVLAVAVDPDVVIRPRGADAFGDLPALELAPAERMAAAIEIDTADSAPAQDALRQSILALGLDQIDATAIATEAQRPIDVLLSHAEVRQLTLWQELLTEYNFPASQQFPVFLSRALRWLAGTTAWHPYVAAGRPLPPPARETGFGDVGHPAFDALGADYVPGAADAGPAAAGDGAPVVALLSEAVTLRDAGAQLQAVDAVIDGTDIGLVNWLVLAALALLAVEWFLYRRGLMP